MKSGREVYSQQKRNWGCGLKAFDEVEDDGNQEARQEIDRFAVLDAEDAEAGAKDEYAAYDAEFHPHRLWHAVATIIADGIEQALPAEQYRCGKEHNPTVGGCEDGRGDEVEGGVGVEKGVGRFAPRPACRGRKRGEHGSNDGESADAIEQATGDEALEAPLQTIPRGGRFPLRLPSTTL